MKKQPGVEEHQPIALAQVVAGKSQVQQLIDLRSWGAKIVATGHSLAIPSPLNGQIAGILGVPRIYRSHINHWDQIGAQPYYQDTATAVSGIIAATPTFCTINVPYPGYPYRIEAWARLSMNVPTTVQADMRIYVNGSVIQWQGVRGATQGETIAMCPGFSGTLNAASTVTLGGQTYDPKTMTAGWGATALTVLYCKVVPV